jgi:hypothetical protein
MYDFIDDASKDSVTANGVMLSSRHAYMAEGVYDMLLSLETEQYIKDTVNLHTSTLETKLEESIDKVENLFDAQC